MSRLRRRGLPGPAPAGGPTSCAPKKSAEEGRSRGLPPVPLRNPREYLAITHGLPSLPTGTQAEGSIQVTGAPNDRGRMARRGHTAENNARFGRARALRACARRSRAVLRLPVGAARHAKAAVPPREHFRYGSGDSPAEALRPRRGGWWDAVGSVVHPWQGAADFGQRPTGGGAGVAGAQPLVPFFGSFLGHARKELAVGRLPTTSAARRAANPRPLSVDYRQTAPFDERQI